MEILKLLLLGKSNIYPQRKLNQVISVLRPIYFTLVAVDYIWDLKFCSKTKKG